MGSMSMDVYLKEIHFAVENAMATIWTDKNLVSELDDKVADLQARVDRAYRDAEFAALNPMDADDVAHATGMYWSTYFGDDKDRYYTQQDLEEARTRLNVRWFSINVVSASLLQLAKQGISMVHGSLQACPSGRSISPSLDLKTVVWQGRNQSSHWEEGQLNRSVIQCFQLLSIEVDPKFDNYLSQNLAFSVIEELGWKTHEDFSSDLMSLT